MEVEEVLEKMGKEDWLEKYYQERKRIDEKKKYRNKDAQTRHEVTMRQMKKGGDRSFKNKHSKHSFINDKQSDESRRDRFDENGAPRDGGENSLLGKSPNRNNRYRWNNRTIGNQTHSKSASNFNKSIDKFNNNYPDPETQSKKPNKHKFFE